MSLKDIKDKYAIVGVGYTPQGNFPDRSEASFYVEASVSAIKDAGLRKEDIDGLIVYRAWGTTPTEDEVTAYMLAEYLGISPNAASQEANCCRGHLLHAMSYLDSGLCKNVLIVYAFSAVSSGRTWVEAVPYLDNNAFGHAGFNAQFAMVARRMMHLYGTGPEAWGRIAVGLHKWANLNPIALAYKDRLTLADYLKLPYNQEPLRSLDRHVSQDGGRAVIVTTLERARALRHPPAVIMGIGQYNPSRYYTNWEEVPSGPKVATDMALRMAGITLNDINACEIYDCYTFTVDYSLLESGFYGPGESVGWLKGGTIEPGGRMPVNTSGGNMYESYYMGLGPLSEGVMQIMGRCGDRQLGPKTRTKEPEIILVSDIGALKQLYSVAILRRL